MRTIKHGLMIAGVALILAGLPGETRADIYGFGAITPNATAGNVAAGESQLSVEVTDYGPSGGLNRVLFMFRNAGPAQSSITDVYFDDGTLLSLADLIDADQNGGDPYVDFTQKALGNVCPPDLPDGEALAVDFDVTANFSADSDHPNTPLNGVNPNEELGVIFTLFSGLDFHDLLDALELGLNDPAQTGNLRIGIHVQAFGNGESISFVNGPRVPLPGAVLLGTMGLCMAGWRLRGRRESV